MKAKDLTPEQVIARAAKAFAKAVRYYASADELGSNPSHSLGHIEHECNLLRVILRRQHARERIRAERAAKGNDNG